MPPVSVTMVEMRNSSPGSLTMPGASLEPDRDAVSLEDRQHHRQIARVLVEDLAPLFAFFLDRFERRNDRAQELDDDRRRDIGHDVQREHRHALNGAAREHVEHVEDALLLPKERGLERRGVDAGNRNVGSKPEDDERAQGEPDALLEFVGLGEGGPVDIGCELFGGRRHGEFAPDGASGLAPCFTTRRFRQPRPALAETPLAYGRRARQCHPRGDRRSRGGGRSGFLPQRLEAAAGFLDCGGGALRRRLDFEARPCRPFADA